MSAERSHRPTAPGHASIVIDFRTAETDVPSRSDRAWWQNLEDFAALVSTMAIFDGTGAEVFLNFGHIEIRNVNLAKLRNRVSGRIEPIVDAEIADYRDELERAVAELERRDRQARRPSGELVTELRRLLS